MRDALARRETLENYTGAMRTCRARRGADGTLTLWALVLLHLLHLLLIRAGDQRLAALHVEHSQRKADLERQAHYVGQDGMFPHGEQELGEGRVAGRSHASR